MLNSISNHCKAQTKFGSTYDITKENLRDDKPYTQLLLFRQKSFQDFQNQFSLKQNSNNLGYKFTVPDDHDKYLESHLLQKNVQFEKLV